MPIKLPKKKLKNALNRKKKRSKIYSMKFIWGSLKIKQAKQKIIKFSIIIAYAAIKHEAELAIEAKTNPNLRPITLIIFAANIVDIAIPIT